MAVAETNKKSMTGGRKAALVVCCLLFMVLFVSYGLRSSFYLKARLSSKLSELSEVLHGTIEYEDVYALGMTGLVLTHVRFVPEDESVAPISLGRVTVYPALLGMFVGDLNASQIEFWEVSAHFDLSRSDSPDVAWLAKVFEASAGSEVNVDPGLSAVPALPVIRCESCHVTVDLAESDASFAVRSQSFEVLSRADRDVIFRGDPIRTCVADACFDLKLARVQYRDSLFLSSLEVSGYESGGNQVDSLVLNNIEIGRNEKRHAVRVEGGSFEGSISEESFLKAFSGVYSVDFSLLELLHERDTDRIGIGVALREADGATARIYGGYAFDAGKLAVTFDTNRFDFARFVRHANFTRRLRLDHFPVSGKLRVIAEPEKRRAWFEADASVSDGALYSEMIAKDVLGGISGEVEASALVDLSEKTFSMNGAKGRLGEIGFELSASRVRMAGADEQPNHQVRFNLKSAGESGSFISSLPEGFAPALSGYELSGPYALELSLSYDEANLDALALSVDFDLSMVETLKYDPRSDFKLLQDDNFQIYVNAATIPLKIGPREPNWVTFYDLPRDTAYAFIASEDGKFFSHPGFDIRAIRASLIADLKADKIVRGGSTISQQVVKNLFLNQDKTLSRKFQEAFLTWQMEKSLPKLRIFELYLNLAHWAKDVYGLRGASQYYFQKPVSRLTLRESLFLASILPNPIIFGRQYAENRLSSSRINKMIMVGNALLQAKRISQESWDEALPLLQEGKISDRPRPKIEPEGIQ
ncbi:MAG: transglycosylase domain-containing protein [Proteobacteria bacterium]|nr:transglycosylase domain-containing protein [Pseudomonadota bacterium]